MLFNSLEFAIFLPLVFILYWAVPKRNLHGQNALILVASYFFYGWWDWKFLSLIAISTTVDYIVGNLLMITSNKTSRKILLLVSILINLGFLVFFKYYNFFIDSFQSAFTFLGKPINIQGLNIILPVGISFYTFQTLSYTIDVYRNKLKPTKNILSFATFVAFFPQLVAGPIERATNLLPQFKQKRVFNSVKATDGLKQALWGLFKKVVIADNCAVHVDFFFSHSSDYSGSTLLLGALLFSIQIYCDFSGYSDIAIGTARLFGIHLKNNFAFPYFSRNIAEFWRRWHISLSTWFRDYVYIPLGGSRGNTRQQIRNVFIIFLVSGFWHGANWTFIAWGALNAIYFLPSMLTKNNRKYVNGIAENRFFPQYRELIAILSTFIIVTLAWVFFRATSITHAINYLKAMFFGLVQIGPYIFTKNYIINEVGIILPLLLLFMLLIEWIGRNELHALATLGIKWRSPVRWAFYYCLVLIILNLCVSDQQFIYFQF